MSEPQGICLSCKASYSGEEASCAGCGEPLLLQGKLRVIRQLGKGGSSHTYEALDTTDQKRYALKVLSMQGLNDWKYFELFERQFEVLRGLDHPGVPKAFAFFEETRAGTPCRFFLHELIEGETLDRRITQGARFEEKSARRLLEQLLDILAYLHGLSPPVLHRDIKPSNIMLRPDGSPVLIDFDSARSLGVDLQAADGTMVGTAGFFPMEQLAGRVVPASDIYALGMTLIAALSRKDVNSLPIERMKVRFAPFVNVSPAFLKVLEKMVEPAVEDRFPSAAAVKEALREMDRPESTVQRPPGFYDKKSPPPPRTVSRPAPRPSRSWVGWLLVAVFLVFIPFLVFYSLLKDNRAALQVSSSLEEASIGAWQEASQDVFLQEGVVWASGVVDFSSKWGESTPSWGAAQALGPPDVFPTHGDSTKAWASDEQDGGLEWLWLRFPQKTRAEGVVIVETLNPGAVIRVDDMSDPDAPVALWEDGAGSPGVSSSRALRILLPEPREISALRVVLDTSLVTGWNEIDAVGLIPVEKPPPPPPVADTPPPDALSAEEEAAARALLDIFSRRNVQWASEVLGFSSEWQSDSWSARQALGPPDTFPKCGDNAKAWAPKGKDDGEEWLEVSFSSKVRAEAIVVVENLNPEALVEIADISRPEAPEILWTPETAPAGSGGGKYGKCRIFLTPLTAPRDISALRLTLDTSFVKGDWEEIDAVGLLPAPQ